MTATQSRIRICFAAQMKPAPVAGFGILKENFTMSASRILHFRKPRLVKAKRGWYIEYWYLVPDRVKEVYNNKKWVRFQVREDINRRKGQEKEIYAAYLREVVEEHLKGGFNPFTPEMEIFDEREIPVEEKKILSAEEALLMFLEVWETRGLDQVSTMRKYRHVINRLIQWLHKKRIPYIDIEKITSNHIEAFLKDMKQEHGFGNREYNNHYDFTRTAFNYMVKKKYIAESPMKGIDKQKAHTTKHRYYDEKSLNDITRVLLLKDPYVFLAFQTVYYLCVRSEKELSGLKVGNIKWEQNKILADVTKGGSERYIHLDQHLKELFLSAGIDKYPGHHFIFGTNGHPSEKPFGKDFFGKRFRKARKEAGIEKVYTFYGMKHTRIIHLKQAGLDDSTIMELSGHKSFTSYAKYLRDLGIAGNPERIDKVSRKI